TTYTCALYGFRFNGWQDNQLLQMHSCPVISVTQGKEVIKSIFNELGIMLPQSKNNLTSSAYDAFAYALTVLFYENFKNAYRSEQGYIKKDVLIKDVLSPINYVIQRRMTEAKFALTNTEASLAEISWRVGYENVDHFAKLFQRHVGCTPSDYRKQFKNNLVEQECLMPEV
ncbi:MAG: AraC family transcriptional regulator, partial [Citrobacter sp.]